MWIKSTTKGNVVEEYHEEFLSAWSEINRKYLFRSTRFKSPPTRITSWNNRECTLKLEIKWKNNIIPSSTRKLNNNYYAHSGFQCERKEIFIVFSFLPFRFFFLFSSTSDISFSLFANSCSPITLQNLLIGFLPFHSHRILIGSSRAGRASTTTSALIKSFLNILVFFCSLLSPTPVHLRRTFATLHDVPTNNTTWHCSWCCTNISSDQLTDRCHFPLIAALPISSDIRHIHIFIYRRAYFHYLRPEEGEDRREGPKGAWEEEWITLMCGEVGKMNVCPPLDRYGQVSTREEVGWEV